MKIVPSTKRDFYIIPPSAPKAVDDYIRFKIPAKFRVYAEQWHVHADYLGVICKLFDRTGISVDSSAVPAYILQPEGQALTQGPFETLFLRRGAPQMVVDAVWKALARYYHPDVSTGDNELFLKYKKAYDMIKNKE